MKSAEQSQEVSDQSMAVHGGSEEGESLENDQSTFLSLPSERPESSLEESD
jgi:hypothetical protein